MKRLCSVDGCGTDASCRFNGIWYCNKHYLRMYTNGTTELLGRKRTTKLTRYSDHASIITANGSEILIDLEDIEPAMRYSWCISKTGYAVANIQNKVTKMHRYLLSKADINISNMVVDHINANKLDNRRVNLRTCSQSFNGKNLPMKKNNNSGHTGVNKKRNGRYRARIMVNYKEICLGCFDNIDDAICARKEAEIRYYGMYAPHKGAQSKASIQC